MSGTEVEKTLSSTKHAFDKTLQIIAEQLSLKGVPSLLMDIKGDLSGLAMPGSMNEHIAWRHKVIGLDYTPASIPVELMTISNFRFLSDR